MRSMRRLQKYSADHEFAGVPFRREATPLGSRGVISHLGDAKLLTAALADDAMTWVRRVVT
jgi:hypothetical protein